MSATWVHVPHIPMCQLCDLLDSKPDVPAVYDSASKFGPWGFMCEEHKQSHGVPGLGTGIAQRLILDGDAPPAELED